MLLAESLAARGQTAKADELTRRLLVGEDARPEAVLQLARVYFRGGNAQGAVAALESAWSKQPDLLLARIAELAPLYVQSKQTDALAKALRSVQDENVRQQHAYDVINAFREIGNRPQQAEDAIELLKAAAAFAPANARDYAYSSLAERLAQQNRRDEAWEAYRRSVLPPDGPANQLSSNAPRLADATIEQKKTGRLDALIEKAAQEHPAWRSCGELLAAMIRQRQGDEAPLVEVAKKFRSDPTYAEPLRRSGHVLRAELARSNERPVLELAAELWEAQIEQLRRQSFNSSTSYTQFDALAQIYIKLGQVEKARSLWLAAINAPAPNYSNDYLVSHQFQRREAIAPKMLAAGLHLDALRLFQECQEAAQTSAGERYGLRPRAERQQPQMRQAILGVLAEQLDEALASLEKELSGAHPPELSPFFAVAAPPWTAAEQQRLSADVRGDWPADVQILPALLRRAKAQGKLPKLTALIEKKVQQHPGYRRLAALGVLARASQETPEQAPQPLLELLRSGDAEAAALAAASLGAFQSPEATEALASLAQANPQARSTALGALARQDTPPAAAAAGKLLAAPDPLQRRQAQEALERMKTPEAKKLFRWERAAFDDFQGGPSLSWQVLRHDPARISYEKNPGALTITTHAGEFHLARADYKNVFLIDNPAGAEDFQVTACVVGFTPEVPFQQAAILCWNDENNYIKLSYEATGRGPTLAVIPEFGGAVPARADVRNITHHGRLWLRLTKCGNRYFFASSTDGQAFHTHGEIAWGDGRPRRLGLAAASGGPSDVPSIDAAFDFFEVAVAKGEAVLNSTELAIAQATQAIDARPGDAALRFHRGDLYARRARWKEAAADFAKGLDLNPEDHWHWYRAAALYLQLEDRENYRRCCRELLRRFGAADAPHIAERIAKICAVAPEPVELEQARRLARQAVQSDPGSNIYHWFLLAQGIVEYRAGEYEQAIQTLTQCLERTPEPVVDCRTPAYLFLAMARRQTGDEEGYRRDLKAGQELIERLASPERGPEIASWNDWILAHLAHREASDK